MQTSCGVLQIVAFARKDRRHAKRHGSQFGDLFRLDLLPGPGDPQAIGQGRTRSITSPANAARWKKGVTGVRVWGWPVATATPEIAAKNRGGSTTATPTIWFGASGPFQQAARGFAGRRMLCQLRRQFPFGRVSSPRMTTSSESLFSVAGTSTKGNGSADNSGRYGGDVRTTAKGFKIVQWHRAVTAKLIQSEIQIGALLQRDLSLGPKYLPKSHARHVKGPQIATRQITTTTERSRVTCQVRRGGHKEVR